MRNWEFSPVDLSTWRDKINGELNNKQGGLSYYDEIEGFEISIAEKNYQEKYHSEEIEYGNISTKNAVSIDVTNEKEANELALYCLNYGADALFFNAKKPIIDWSIVLKNIELFYIQSWFLLESTEQEKSLNSVLDRAALEHATVVVMSENNQSMVFPGFEMQQIGSPVFIELSYLLYYLNNYIIDSERSKIEEDSLIFTCGMSGNYFMDVAKIRALKFLITQLLDSYAVKPKKIEFHAHSGWTNKSLEDVDTNLLRQTTEIMAAYAGNVDAIFNNPSTKLSTNNTELKDWRLSLNVINLLKEESYFDRVKNPLDGSHVFGQLVDGLIDKSWAFFTAHQEKNEFDFLELTKNEISSAREIKRKKFVSNEITKIGINSFKLNQTKNDHFWGKIPSFLGFPYLIFEKEL
ncbi:MAG: hypothetical protein RL037_1041 [Bacteroidota bacterium]